MIKLVFISPSMQGGGAERMQMNIMHSLPEDKYEIYFINTGTDSKPVDLMSHINYIQYYKVHARDSFWHIRKDLIHIHPKYIFTTSIVVAYLLQLIRLTLRFKTKLFVRIAVPPSEYPNKNLKSRLLRKLNSLTLKYTDLIIAQTEFSKNDVAHHYKVPLKKIQVIRNIVDENLLDKKADLFIPSVFKIYNYNIVASGALYSVKGFDLLIDAMREVVNYKSNACLYILGDERYETGYRQQLEKQIVNNSLEKHVFLLGHQDNPYPYYKAADLFVLSSRKEGFPNVVLENLYYGTPVVVTDCVDFSEIIEYGVNGVIVTKNSIEALLKGIMYAINELSKIDEVQLDNYNYKNLFI